jgi:hypothetical protein
MNTYDIWQCHHSTSTWSKTEHSVRARTDKEAQARTRQKFVGFNLTSMSLVAVLRGETPQ